MGSGGGSSGAVSFPDYMENTHEDWLGYTSTGVDDTVDVDLIEVMDTALGAGGNPLENASLTDPATDFGVVQTRYGELETLVDGLDEETDWDSIIDNAVAKVDEAGVLEDIDMDTLISSARGDSGTGLTQAIQAAVDAVDDDVIAEAVAKFVKVSSVQKERAVSRFSSTLADINAINSSAYMFGLAIIEGQHLQDANRFQAELSTGIYSEAMRGYIQIFRDTMTSRLKAEIMGKTSRDSTIRDGINMMVTMLNTRVSATAQTTSLLAEIKRLKIVGVQEYEMSEIDLDYKFATWDFEVFQRSMNVLGGLGGGSGFVPNQPSRVGSAIGGALAGAGTGAAIGSVVPGVGTAIGAGVGAVLGIGAALLS